MGKHVIYCCDWCKRKTEKNEMSVKKLFSCTNKVLYLIEREKKEESEKNDLHFCSLGCFIKWISKDIDEARKKDTIKNF